MINQVAEFNKDDRSIQFTVNNQIVQIPYDVVMSLLQWEPAVVDETQETCNDYGYDTLYEVMKKILLKSVTDLEQRYDETDDPSFKARANEVRRLLAQMLRFEYMTDEELQTYYQETFGEDLSTIFD